MTEQSQPYNLRTLRKLLLESFNTDELRALVLYDDRLGSLTREFAPADSITVMVDKTIAWCDRRDLLPYLVQLVKEERPEKYKLFEADLLAPAIPETVPVPSFTPSQAPHPLADSVGRTEQPAEQESTRPIPEILTIASPISLRLVRIPAGEFLMGSVAARDAHARDEEFPPHRVHVPEFHIGQYPVTNLQYQAFVKATEREAPYPWKSGRIPPGKGNHPVVTVTWHAAVEFCDWLSRETKQPFRLPTEAEWEKAARGADGRIYPWGDEPPDGNRCNFGENAKDTTTIGRYSPQGDSPYGCADMAGNVFEWCQSLHEPYPYQADDRREDLEADGMRVLRGGAWRTDSAGVRCAYRYYHFIPGGGYGSDGFRVARGPLE
jgi:formylglycine-generating enzyme required for sulfatase activity